MSVFRGITRLVAEGFRGATSRLELAFQPSQPFVLLFGENGTGKSSIADAIEFAIYGSRGSLADVSSTEVRHLRSLGTPAPPLRVELQAGGDVWQAELRGSKPERSGPARLPRLKILRRSRLMKIVAATPADRYGELRGFVDVEPVSAAERSLDEAVKEAARRLEDSARRQAEAEAELGAAWDTAGRPGESAEAWARGLEAPQEDPRMIASRNWLGTAVRALERLTIAHDRAAQSRRERIAAAEALESLGASSTRDSREDGDSTLVSLLVAAQEAVTRAQDLTACPVCKQPVDRDSLRGDLEERLSRLREETDWLKRREAAAAELRRSEAVADSAAQELEQALAELHTVVQEPPPGMEAKLKAQLETLASAAPPGWAEPGGDRSTGSVEFLDEVLRALREQEGAQRQAETERTALVRLAQRILNRTAEARSLSHQSGRLNCALDIVRETRKEYTTRVLTEVEGEVNRLYEQLHPGEALGPIRLRLDPNRRASLLQRTAWGDEVDLAPQACFSESHLLTLAFCLWLALAKRDRPEETILVLDDVVFAIDEPHMRRLAALLAAEAPRFAQVLATTHSRRFRRHLHSGIAASGKLDCRTLRWSLQGGIVHGASPHQAERLAEAISEPILDRQAVASRAGVLLEVLLRQLAVLYRRRVPFGEPTEPDLGELLSAWSLRDADKVRVERLEGDDWDAGGTFGTLLKPLQENRDVRNLIGAHLNTEGDEVPDAEVLAFGRCVLELWTLLVCPHCGQIPCKPQDDLFVCHCRQTRMRPNRLD